jgi:hypothetical protein
VISLHQNLFFLFVYLLSGCASGPQLANKNLRQLHDELCFGRSDRWTEVSGSIWVKLDSSQGSAQFPANVLVNEKGATIEVTDLFGGVQGVLRVQNGAFIYQGQGAESPIIKDILSRQSLFGLSPNQFAGVFLGKLPCFERVSSGSISKSVVTFRNASNDREVERFEVKAWGTQNLVKTMESRGLKLESSDYEEPFGLPKVWTVGSKFGTCQIRWRDRNLLVKKPPG